MKPSILLRVYITLLCSVSILPLVMVLWVGSTGERFARFPPRSYSIHWYREALANEGIRRAIFFSLRTAGAAAMIAAVVGTLAAISIARYRGGWSSRFIEYVAFAPLMLPNLIIGVSILNLFVVANLPLSTHGVLVAQTLMSTPFVIRFTLASLLNTPPELEQVSLSLGASRFYTLRRVTAPQVAPGVIAGTLVAFLVSFDELDAALFLSRPGSTTFPVEIFWRLQDSASPIPIAAAGLVIGVSITLVLIIDRTFGVLTLMISGPENRAE